MSKDKDEFGTRMKVYEQAEAGRKACPLLPVMIRLDGKGFSKWTKGLKRPYDSRLSEIMVEVTKFLTNELNACFSYTQSDEISLVLYCDKRESDILYDGKLQKLVSVSASMATAFFNSLATKEFPDKPLAFFDSRVWAVPTLTEAANAFLWREQDATKNSISMAARHYYSHKELHGKKGSEMQEMLFQKGVNWNEYPSFSVKRGTFVQRKKKYTKFTTGELEKLPEQHEARRNPDLTIERSVVEEIEMPKFSSVTNRVGVIFRGEDPISSNIKLTMEFSYDH